MSNHPQLEGLSLAEKRMLLAQLLQEKAQQGLVCQLSHGQRGLWVLNEMDTASAACNIHLPTRIRSRLDISAFHRSLQALVDRHPSLRTTFESRDGELLQRVHEKMPVSFEVIDAASWSKERLRQTLDEYVHRPFDLAHGPPLRTHLLSRDDDDHIFLATAHHIVMDFWSVIVLLKEIRDLYPAECEGRTLPPAPESSDYADFVRWQSQMLAGSGGRRLQSFWERHLGGAPHVLDLPTDHSRPPSFTYRAGDVPCAIAADLTRQLTAFAADQHTTLYTVLFSALQVLLGRYSGQDDFIVGSPFSGRTRPGFEETVGCFINMLPIRADLSDDPTFRELLVRVRDTSLDALENQDYPFSLILQRLNVNRDRSRPPLVQVSFTLERSQWQGEVGRGRFLFPKADAHLQVADLLGETYYVPQRTCQLDLEWVLEQSDDTIHGVLRYCADLFEEAAMLRMVERYQTLLANAAENPNRPISELAWFPDSEQHTVICEWNQTSTSFPNDVCLHQLFERQAAETPDAVALRLGERAIRYADLDAWSNRLAHQLCHLGVGPGKLVALCFHRSPEMVAAILATLKAGGAFVPLDPNNPTERLRLMLDETSPSVLLTQADLQTHVPRGAWEVVCVGDSDAQTPTPNPSPEDGGGGFRTSPEDGGGGFRTSPEDGGGGFRTSSNVQPGDLAYVVYTSGSTGKPKGVMVEHRAICNTVLWRRQEFVLRPGDRMLSIVPYVFDASFCNMFAALTSGAELVLPDPGEELNPARLIERIAQQRLTILPIPTRLLNVVVADPTISNCRDVRMVFTGGEAMPAELPSRVLETLGVPLHNLYGPTEAAVEATFWTCRPGDVRASHRIGRPIANARTYVLDPNRKPQPIGVPGELYIGGAGVARGYLNDPELTADRFLADPFVEEPAARMYRTGDCCRWLPHGSLEFLGRLDDQIKLRGHRIELGEIEHALASLPAVREAAVAVRSDRADEPQLVAYVVPHDQQSPPSSDELHGDLKTTLPASHVPTVYERLDSLPRTPSGKLDRRALPAPQFERMHKPFVAPHTRLEKFLAELWRETLKVDSLGVDDSFYELGGTSIQGAVLISQLQEELGQRVRLTALMEMSTVAALSRHLADSYPEAIAERFGVESLPPAVPSASASRDDQDLEHGADNGDSTVGPADLLVPLQPDGHRPPLFMVHPPGGIVICYQLLAHHIGHDQPLYGIRARGLHGEEKVPARLEDMAAEYTAAVRTVQPTGPYLLGGWSLGGVVALEMAQQFLAEGERIGLLAFLDTTIPQGQANAQYSSELEASGLEYGLDITLEELAELDPDEQLPFLYNHAQQLGVIDEEAPPDVVEQVLDDLKRIFHAHVRLASNYALRPYPDQIALFRPQNAPVEVPVPDDRGWGRLAGSVDVHFVPGLHHTMVKEPHIQVLAARLRESIASAVDITAD